MGGFDDHVAIIGDWLPPSPSPRSFFSAILSDDIIGARSVSEPKADENKNGFSFPGHEGQIGSENTEEKTLGMIDQAINKQGAFSEQKMSSRSGLVERIAARAGFNAPRLNTEIIRPADISQNPDMRSPYLTIPPGLSPTTLLDSPVFLSNSLVQPSPTTGKFQFAPNGNGKSSMMMSDASDTSKDNLVENINTSSFAFKPVPESTSFSRGAMNQVPPSFPVRQSFPSFDVSVPSESSFPSRNTEPSKIQSQNGMNALPYQTNISVASFDRNVTEGNNNFSSEQNRPFGISASSAVEQSQAQQNEPQDEDGDQRDANINNAPSEDGYNWRKYGQKQVKGSEYPRSYYKCTHPNCPVKKKVERSHEGYITEIIYKGAHNHPKPPPARKSGMGSSNGLSDMQGDMIDQDGTGADGSDPVWGKGNTDWSSHDNLEVTSSALQVQNGAAHFESSDAVDGCSTFSNEEEEGEEEEEDRATHGSVSLGYDGEGDESESKRRKVEAYAADVSGATRAIREPRVVVQTTSEVDILDDGYRWRKYGQKVVKGNPNPRSYYKCTNAGCTVRKHVERASHDLKSVITTYEGKHNHDVPAARNSSHVNSNTMPQQAVQSQMHRPDPSQLHNGMARFDRGPTLGSFGPPGPGRQQLGYGFGMNQPGLANLAMAGLGQNQGKMPVLPVHQYLAQPCQMNDMGFMLPKGEPKVEPMTDPGLNISSGSSVYHQIMSRLGPQM